MSWRLGNYIRKYTQVDPHKLWHLSMLLWKNELVVIEVKLQFLLSLWPLGMSRNSYFQLFINKAIYLWYSMIFHHFWKNPKIVANFLKLASYQKFTLLAQWAEKNLKKLHNLWITYKNIHIPIVVRYHATLWILDKITTV